MGWNGNTLCLGCEAAESSDSDALRTEIISVVVITSGSDLMSIRASEANLR
jgi:hypothetical protein